MPATPEKLLLPAVSSVNRMMCLIRSKIGESKTISTKLPGIKFYWFQLIFFGKVGMLKKSVKE